MRETISGTLNVIRQRKRYSNLMDDYIASVLEDDGTIERREYPPIYYVTTERRRHAGEGEGAYLYRFRGRPKALKRDMEGWCISVRATMDEWQNQMGAHLTRPQILGLSDPKETQS